MYLHIDDTLYPNGIYISYRTRDIFMRPVLSDWLWFPPVYLMKSIQAINEFYVFFISTFSTFFFYFVGSGLEKDDVL